MYEILVFYFRTNEGIIPEIFRYEETSSTRIRTYNYNMKRLYKKIHYV